VTALEGWPDLRFGLYSGYVGIPNTKGKEVHYVATLAQQNWETAPLIFWYNGGPGCSSMMGLMLEHGPYVIPEGGNQFVRNQWAWNREANVFYVDAPSTVGFSICDSDDDNCIYDDKMTATENLQALAAILLKFPELKNNSLYLAGEDYAGIFVPQLAMQIDEWNKNCSVSKNCPVEPNMKGFIVGNGYTDPKYDSMDNMVDHAYWFGLIDTKLYEILRVDDCTLNLPISNQSQPCQRRLSDF
jgi:serine carboxypeptidase-like clade II